ncbi:MAG: hypothetical protein Q9226_006911, partial [Calogaya cf. arnoldii]
MDSNAIAEEKALTRRDSTTTCTLPKCNHEPSPHPDFDPNYGPTFPPQPYSQHPNPPHQQPPYHHQPYQQPHGPPNDKTHNERVLEALAPKQHDIELTRFELALAAQYEEAYFIVHTFLESEKPPDTGPPYRCLHLLNQLSFISQPISTFKCPSKYPSIYELYLAYKICFFRFIVDPGEAGD